MELSEPNWENSIGWTGGSQRLQHGFFGWKAREHSVFSFAGCCQCNANSPTNVARHLQKKSLHIATPEILCDKTVWRKRCMICMQFFLQDLVVMWLFTWSTIFTRTRSTMNRPCFFVIFLEPFARKTGRIHCAMSRYIKFCGRNCKIAFPQMVLRLCIKFWNKFRALVDTKRCFHRLFGKEQGSIRLCWITHKMRTCRLKGTATRYRWSFVVNRGIDFGPGMWCSFAVCGNTSICNIICSKLRNLFTQTGGFYWTEVFPFPNA